MSRYRIYTETGSVHEVDLEQQTYVRLHVGRSGELRRDGEQIRLLRCVLGVPGVGCWFKLQLREDGVKTSRTTSPVVRIDEY